MNYGAEISFRNGTSHWIEASTKFELFKRICETEYANPDVMGYPIPCIEVLSITCYRGEEEDYANFDSNIFFSSEYPYKDDHTLYRMLDIREKACKFLDHDLCIESFVRSLTKNKLFISTLGDELCTTDRFGDDLHEKYETIIKPLFKRMLHTHDEASRADFHTYAATPHMMMTELEIISDVEELLAECKRDIMRNYRNEKKHFCQQFIDLTPEYR